MFGPHFYIDTLQSGKRAVVDSLVKDPVLKKAAYNYIDAQTSFAKMLANNALDIVKHSTDTISSCLFPKKEQAAQAPYKVEPKTRKTKVEEAANTDINTQGE